MRLLPVLLLLALPATASAAHTDPNAPIYNQTGPVTLTLHSDGQSASSGVAYKLSTESAWHRCLSLNPTVTLTLPAGDYSLELADDISRQWFDENQPSDPTPECQETGAPKAQRVSTFTFYVRNPPPVEPKPLVDVCGPELAKAAKLHRKAESAQAHYRSRRTASRKRAWKKADATYRRARRAFDAHC